MDMSSGVFRKQFNKKEQGSNLKVYHVVLPFNLKREKLLFIHSPICSPVCHCFPTKTRIWTLSHHGDYKNEHGDCGQQMANFLPSLFPLLLEYTVILHFTSSLRVAVAI